MKRANRITVRDLAKDAKKFKNKTKAFSFLDTMEELYSSDIQAIKSEGVVGVKLTPMKSAGVKSIGVDSKPVESEASKCKPVKSEGVVGVKLTPMKSAGVKSIGVDSKPMEAEMESYIIPKDFFCDCFKKFSSPSEFLVYIFLWRLSVGEGFDFATVSMNTMVQSTCLSLSTIRVTINSLIKKGYLEFTENGPKKERSYKILA